MALYSHSYSWARHPKGYYHKPLPSSQRMWRLDEQTPLQYPCKNTELIHCSTKDIIWIVPSEFEVSQSVTVSFPPPQAPSARTVRAKPIICESVYETIWNWSPQNLPRPNSCFYDLESHSTSGLLIHVCFSSIPRTFFSLTHPFISVCGCMSVTNKLKSISIRCLDYFV